MGANGVFVVSRVHSPVIPNQVAPNFLSPSHMNKYVAVNTRAQTQTQHAIAAERLYTLERALNGKNGSAA